VTAPLLAPAQDAAQALAELRALVASNAYAITFQSLAQYRTALLRTIDDFQHGLTAHASIAPASTD
jgi:hypothetical protein